MKNNKSLVIIYRRFAKKSLCVSKANARDQFAWLMVLNRVNVREVLAIQKQNLVSCAASYLEKTNRACKYPFELILKATDKELNVELYFIWRQENKCSFLLTS